MLFVILHDTNGVEQDTLVKTDDSIVFPEAAEEGEGEEEGAEAKAGEEAGGSKIEVQ